MSDKLGATSRASLATDAIERAIVESLPRGPGQRHKLVFELARGLKGIAALSDADPRDLRPYVQQWHKAALPVITTEHFEETWIDFLRAWPRVKFPKGVEPMTQIFARAKASELPDIATNYQQAELRMLVALCRELQRAAGDGPFYLSCRTAGRLLQVDHTTAWRWLWLLEQERVLNVAEKGSQSKRRASRYRYIAN